MVLTDVVICVCSALALTLVTDETAALAPETEYAMVTAPTRRRAPLYKTVPVDVSVTCEITTLSDDALDAVFIAVVIAAVRLVTAAAVSVVPEKADVGSDESAKEPVAVASAAVQADAPAADV